jgi:hypothetical protein
VATVSAGSGASNTTGGDHTNTTTPAANDLIVVVVHTSNIAGGTTSVTDNNADGLGTYAQVITAQTSGANTDRLSVWVRNALVGSATSTIFTATQASSNGGGLRVLRVTGMTKVGATAVRSSGVQGSQGTGTTPAPVLSLTPLSTSLIITAIRNSTNTATISPRTGYTEDVDTGYASPTSGFEVAWLASGETSATLTHAGTSPSAFASFGIELDATSSTDGNPTLATVNATTAVATPVVTSDPTTVPTTVDATTTVPTPAVTSDPTVTTAVVNATTSIDTPSVVADQNPTTTPTTVNATTTIPTPVVTVDPDTIVPTTVNATTTIPTPDVIIEVVAPVVTVDATTSVPTPVVTSEPTVTPTTVDATTTVPTPVVTSDPDTITPATVNATTTIPTPDVTGVTDGTDGTPTLATVDATTAIATPVVTSEPTVTPTTVDATTSVPTPSVVADQNPTVTPSTVTATTSIPTPTVSTVESLSASAMIHEVSDTDADSYTSSAVSFTAGRWYVADVVVRKTGFPIVPTAVTTSSFDFAFEAAVMVDPAAGQDAFMSRWYVLADATVSDAITVTGVGGSTNWTGFYIHVTEISAAGTDDLFEGTTVTNTASTGTAVTATLGAYANSNDRPLVFVFSDDDGTAITFEGGYTQLGDQETGTAPDGKSGVAWHDSSADTSITSTVGDDGWGVIASKLHSISGDGEPTLTTVTATTTVPTPTIELTYFPGDITVTVDIPTPAVTVDALVTLTTVNATATVNTPSLEEPATTTTVVRRPIPNDPRQRRFRGNRPPFVPRV